jgi:DNA polymerase-3 subunit delta'
MVFSNILGHSRSVGFLSRVMKGGRLAHAYLFSGPEGVGKATVARAMAAGLLCTDTSTPAPCGHCPGCRQFASGNHPDFLHIRPDGASIKIDQIRAVKKQLTFSPFAGGRRIVLVEEAQTMRREAGNSLLKMLEEPPPDNLFLLVASDAEPVLPTILSRCQVIAFAPLADTLAADIIRRHAPELGGREALTLARLSEGCPGRALAMETGEVLALHEQMIPALLEKKRSEARSVEEGLSLAGAMAELKTDLDLLLDLLKVFFKDALLLSLREESPAPISAARTKELTLARERWNLSQLSDKIRAVDSAVQALARNCNRGLVCEVLMLRLIA